MQCVLAVKVRSTSTAAVCRPLRQLQTLLLTNRECLVPKIVGAILSGIMKGLRNYVGGN